MTNLIYGSIVVIALAVLSNQSTTPFIKCPKGEPPLNVRVNNCTKSPCLLRRGSDVVAEWDFTVKNKTKSLRPKLRIGRTANRTNSNYPIPQTDACTSLSNGTCPLEAGDSATYELKMPILKRYPKVPLAIEFSFLDDKNNLVVCFKLSGRVVD